MRASQWVNSSIACRIIQNICEQSWGPGQAASLPQWRQSEAWGTWPSGSLGCSLEQPLLQEAVGPNYLPGDLEPSSSLQPPATTSHQKWSCLVPLQMWGFLLVFWEG